MAVVKQSVGDGRNDDGVAEEFVPYSIDWLRRLLLRGRLWPDNPLHTLSGGTPGF